jgi:hypothetical protein
MGAMRDEMWFSDPSTNIFYDVLEQTRHTDKKLVGVYRARLEASDLKLRFAGRALDDVTAVIDELEHGEFLYFDDTNRLKAHFGLAAFLIFLRAALDTAVGGYGAYFSGKTDIDSINDVLKKWPPKWLPTANEAAWGDIKSAYDSADYTWVHALVGRDKGMSLRDLVVHKGTVSIDTIIDENDRGLFVVHVGREAQAPAKLWLTDIFDRAHRFILSLRDQIRAAESRDRSGAGSPAE